MNNIHLPFHIAHCNSIFQAVLITLCDVLGDQMSQAGKNVLTPVIQLTQPT
jgi:hypothetical protein